ncbi:class I SAM-dependent methyltransferase [Halorubellus salinus]|uniref:class I SAM-dependent methyltransferase n=1 Tax=Halorubellus salinus TaxID=755309 RepID=UPI001D06E8B5|nr:class I SAM-dependent methyltransferase [Halorubellus salinus]
MDYDQIADDTAEGRMNSVGRRAKVINELLSLIEDSRGTNGGDLVDLGSGTGYSLFRAMENYDFDSITCVDESEEMLHEGRTQSDRRPDNTKYLVSAIEDINENGSKYDVALLNSVVHHLDDLNESFDSAFQVLRPGGALGIYTLSQEQLNDHHLVRFFPSVAEVNSRRYPPIEDLKTTLDDVGFRHVKSEKVTFDVELDPQKYLSSIVNKYGSVLHLINDEEYEKGVETIRRRIDEGKPVGQFTGRYTIIASTKE